MSDTGDHSKESAEHQPISAQQLSNAFAEMLKDNSEGRQPSSESREDAADDGSGSDESGGVSTTVDQSAPVTPSSVLEAMLFVGSPNNEPLDRQQAANMIEGTSPEEIDDLVNELNEQYAEAGHPFNIVSEGAGYRLVLSAEFGGVRDRFYGRIRQARLSQAAVEVLALVAYNEPISSQKVSKMRGHPSGAILSQLVRRRLLRLERPEENRRRPVYLTTERFLKLFSLERLDELPEVQEIGP
ncbi:MAG: SMC-Scp complex subunit ScpB [Planctomycetota bacterium]|nr:SMC-Scp complex subunit ScpB [Planctomycetota bacterium]